MTSRPLFACAGLAALLLIQAPGCGGDDAPSQASDVKQSVPELPWEVVSDQGETYLSNLFYAEDSDNEQIMPVALDGHVMIDRLVYPTLGNPNLYVKDDAHDSFLVVLRVETELLAHLAPKTGKASGSPHSLVTLDQRPGDELAVFLVDRAARWAGDSERPDAVEPDGVHTLRIEPSRILMHKVPDDMPEPFKRRRTLRCSFDQAAMAGVPGGLYDVRFEVRRDGAVVASEYQYNALRVFDHGPDDGEYSVVSVTDTQVSVGALFDSKTTAKLEDFVDFVSTTEDPDIRQAAFITFNGDLHNGGSPAGLRQRFVATTYNEEAKRIVAALKELPLPIFLTPGNHDGSVSMGHVPRAIELFDKLTFESLEEVVEEAEPKAWPDFDWSAFEQYRDATAALPGGWHRDIFVGSHVRRAGAKTFAKGWLPVPRADRNMVLYDGFNQWRRTYGPLSSSWFFGKNHYVSMNTFELRQHRRTGWGLYSVNFGGGMSPEQLEWLGRDLKRAAAAERDVVLLAHHDPRGGHKGQDLGYYFAQVDYRGIGQSLGGFLKSHVVDKIVCKAPDWALSAKMEDDCTHDGLLEWMRPDEEFDCADADRLDDGRCDTSLFEPSGGSPPARLPRFSGYALIDALAEDTHVRTFLLGHTHYNSLEVLEAGDELVPERVQVDAATAEAFAAIEIGNPVRGYARQAGEGDYDPDALSSDAIVEDNGRFFLLLEAAGHSFERRLQGKGRELVVLRLTTNADITHQKFHGDTMMGFSVIHMTRHPDARGYDLPQLNRVSYFIHAGDDRFDPVADVDIDRTKRLGARDPTNPVAQLFE